MNQRQFDVAIFWALDRLSRAEVKDAIDILHRLGSSGVDFVSFREPYLTSLGPVRDMVAGILATDRERRDGPHERAHQGGLRTGEGPGEARRQAGGRTSCLPDADRVGARGGRFLGRDGPEVFPATDERPEAVPKGPRGKWRGARERIGVRLAVPESPDFGTLSLRITVKQNEDEEVNRQENYPDKEPNPRAARENQKYEHEKECSRSSHSRCGTKGDLHPRVHPKPLSLQIGISLAPPSMGKAR